MRFYTKIGKKSIQNSKDNKIERSRGLRMLTPEELMHKDVNLSYVSRLLNRTFTNALLMRKILQPRRRSMRSWAAIRWIPRPRM